MYDNLNVCTQFVFNDLNILQFFKRVRGPIPRRYSSSILISVDRRIFSATNRGALEIVNDNRYRGCCVLLRPIAVIRDPDDEPTDSEKDEGGKTNVEKRCCHRPFVLWNYFERTQPFV